MNRPMICLEPIRTFATRSSLTAALAGLLIAPAVFADGEASAAIDNQGRLIEARAGLWSASASATEVPALFLDVTADGELTSHLVPGSEDAAEDLSPMVLHDRQRDRVTVVWKTLGDDRKSVRLVQRDADGTFTEAHTVLEAAEDGYPIIRALTSDALTLTLPNGGMSEVRRQLVHFMWWDQDADQPLRYLPLVLIDGELVDPLPSVAVGDLYTSSDVVSPITASNRLLATITLDASDEDRLRATFVDSATHRVTSLELSVEPLEAILFADRINARLTELYGDLGPLSDGMVAEIAIGGMVAEIAIGGADLGLDDTLIDYLTDNAQTFTFGYFELNPGATADDWLAALHTFLGDLLTSIYGTANGGGQTIQIGGGSDDPAQLVDVRMVVDLPAPETGDGATRTYVGRGGAAVVIGWLDPAIGAVHWVEATADPEQPWTETRTLTLGDALDLDAADALLRERVH